LTNLVAQLRALQRSRVTTAMQPLDLCALIDDVHKLLEAELTAHRIRWRSSIETSHCTIVGTFDQLKQVCLNIGLNAVEAMRARGGALRADLIASDTGEQVGVRFRDTGPGIEPENLAKVFEPLFTTKPNGLGLGLPICYEIVQRHNGHITVESQLGHGATFTVWLPLLADRG
jgi:signal transduction histidine kinase